MKNVNISLPETLKNYHEEQMNCGGNRKIGEYVRELILEDKKREAQERLETLLLEGLDSGEATSVTPEFWKGLWAKTDAR